MGKISEILNLAQQRGRELNLPYAGALLPKEAYELLKSVPGARLVDVRTRAELEWVGRVPGAVEIEWQTYPGMSRNPNFLAALEQQIDKEAVVMFLCRSAHRSHAAAMIAAQAGYTGCYNILEGFEGDKNANRQRNKSGGWRLADLPWEQS